MPDNHKALVERLDKLIERQRNDRGDMLVFGEADPEIIDARAAIAALQSTAASKDEK